MENKGLLSVVVPVYNVEQYLPTCIESILNQTVKDLELILIDDGSTDTSGSICDEYEKKYENIQVFHKENGGLTSAWKKGVELATGKYIGFVDSDDWIDSDMYERLLGKILETKAEVAVCGLVFDFEDTKIPKREEISNFQEEVYERKDIEKLYPTFINDGKFFGRMIQPGRVTKLYLASLLRENIKYCDNRVAVGEDMQITFPVFCDVEKLCVVKEFYPYHYRINNASITGKYDSGYLKKIKLLYERMLEISEDKKVYDFTPQIQNDFLSQVVLAIKNEIYRNYKAGRKVVNAHVKEMCEDEKVQEVLEKHTMNQLSLSIKFFLWCMKKKQYNLCYFTVLVFFKLQYYLGRQYKRQ